MPQFDFPLKSSVWGDEKWWHAVNSPFSSGVWAESPNDVPPRPTKKFGAKCMVWGGFTARGVLPLVWLPSGESFNGEFCASINV